MVVKDATLRVAGAGLDPAPWPRDRHDFWHRVDLFFPPGSSVNGLE